MSRAPLALFLVILAIGLFVVYTNPAYQGTKAVSLELDGYNSALTQSEELLRMRDQLLARRTGLPADGVNRLQLLLPDNVDNIRLIIDINDIAARYHMQVQGISVGSSSSGSTNGSPGSSVGGGSTAVGKVSLGFTVTSTYANFVAFLRDLERSLRLTDVSGISFSAGGKDADTYSLAITTYWLK